MPAAARRGHLAHNPAGLAKAPRLSKVQRILEQAAQRRNGARWAIALALGLRQGEALGLKWEHVNLDERTLLVRRNRLRPKCAHGCEEACGKKAGYCPQRVRTNDELTTRNPLTVVGSGSSPRPAGPEAG